ncbi:acyl-CoA dehydrogenase/oxidase [Gongronella butleri]|nr:acyl-CoA dehydrogenase/oxidase [Gongronella butleri]
MSTNSLVKFENLSPKFRELYAKAKDFVDNECIPAEHLFEEQMGKGDQRWKVIPPVLEELKVKARSLGLWNLFLGKSYKEGAGLSNVEYGLIAELTGKCSRIAPEAMNCAAPDTGNMEVFAKYGTEAQKARWLVPLMEGKIRSAFAMTEPLVASSDATNIELNIRREGGEYVLNGRKWWISGAGDPRCAVYLVMGKSDAGNKNKHRQQSIVIVPSDTPGITVVRPLTVFGFDDAPEGHCEIIFKDVRVPVENIVLGEGRGFEVIQGRLGPGRIHHCMRTIGIAERALEYMMVRVTDPTRRTFGKGLSEHGTIVQDIAKSRIEIDRARFLVLNAAQKIDEGNAKSALKEISMAKVDVPSMALRVLDRAIQAHGAGGLSEDFPLAKMYAGVRTLRFADGPDEVHLFQLGRNELRRAEEIRALQQQQKAKAVALLNKAKL